MPQSEEPPQSADISSASLIVATEKWLEKGTHRLMLIGGVLGTGIVLPLLCTAIEDSKRYKAWLAAGGVDTWLDWTIQFLSVTTEVNLWALWAGLAWVVFSLTFVFSGRLRKRLFQDARQPESEPVILEPSQSGSATEWKSRYELFEISPLTCVYRLKEKEAKKSKEPVHYICPNCFETMVKRDLLQPMLQSDPPVLHCQQCNRQYNIKAPQADQVSALEELLSKTRRQLSAIQEEKDTQIGNLKGQLEEAKAIKAKDEIDPVSVKVLQALAQGLNVGAISQQLQLTVGVTRAHLSILSCMNPPFAEAVKPQAGIGVIVVGEQWRATGHGCKWLASRGLLN